MHQDMARKIRKRKQSSFNLQDEPIDQPPSKNSYQDEPIVQPPRMSTRTQVGRQIYNKVVDKQQAPNQLVQHSHSQGQMSKTTIETSGMSTVTQGGGQVHTNFMDKQQNPNQLTHVHRQSQTNENIGLLNKSVMDNQNGKAHGKQQMERITEELINESNEGESDIEENGKKTRGPTYMLEIWGRPTTLPRIQVDFDSLGRPIRKNKKKLTEFLGTLARSGMHCPVDIPNWHLMPNKHKKEMLAIVQARFEIPLIAEDWILKSIGRKWRNWKHVLKTRWFIPNRDVEDLIDERDERVVADQWKNLLTYWNTEKAKEKSGKNKASRSQRIMDHATGKQSFAEIQDELTKEKGRPPTRAEMFDVCYTREKGTPALISQYLTEMKERRDQLPEGSEDPVGQSDIFAQVIGQDRPGRIRMFGDCISPSDVWGEVPNRNTFKRLVLEQQSTISRMQNEIAVLKSDLHKQQRSPVSQDDSQHFSSPSNLSRPALTNQSFRVGSPVYLKSSFHPSKIVAKGFIHCSNSSVEVGTQLLGSNWCQIHVQVVLDPDEQLLIRSYDHYETIRDALGDVISWPCHLVTPSQDC